MGWNVDSWVGVIFVEGLDEGLFGGVGVVETI